MLYIKPYFKYGKFLDKGERVHHLLYNGDVTSDNLTEIYFYENVAFLDANWTLSALQFPSLFYFNVDVRPEYFNHTSGDSTQTIIRKLKNDGTVFLDLSLQFASRSDAADLVITTQSEVKTISEFFPVTNNNSYVQVGISYGGSSMFIYRNRVINSDIIMTQSGQDDSNHLFYVGGVSKTSCSPSCFQGGIKNIALYYGALFVAPATTPIDEYCEEEFYHLQHFSSSKWPLESFFGTGWYHVRRSVPDQNNPTYDILKDLDGKIILGDNLKGNATAQSEYQTMAFAYENSTTFNESTTRPYILWNYDEILVTAGDLSRWAYFTKKELLTAIATAELSSTYTVFSMKGYSSYSPTKLRTIQMYIQNSQRIMIMLNSITTSEDSSKYIIYGELSTSSDFSYGMARYLGNEGANVFVRNSNSSVKPFKCGDGYRTLPEECDDGNARDGDGCSSECKIESSYYCPRGSYNNIFYSDYPCCDVSCEDCTIPGADTCISCRDGFYQQGISCVEYCGDGKKMGQLACDDGNNVDGDGCSATCSVEEGYECTGGSTSGPDTCKNVQKLIATMEVQDSYDQLYFNFNKDVKEFTTSSGSLASFDSSNFSSIQIHYFNIYIQTII